MTVFSTTFFWIFLAFYLLHEAVHLILEWINYQYAKKQTDCPQFYQNKITKEGFARSRNYTLEKSRFAIAAHLSQIPFFWFLIFRDGFNVFDYYAGVHAGYGSLTHSVLFCIYLAIYFGIIQIPFKIYSVFVIEEKYGFNKMSFGLFCLDALKSIAVGSAIGLPLLYLVFWFMKASGNYWWLWVWLAVTGFQLILVSVYPAFLAPLFNKFSPLKDGELKDRITALAKKVKMDLGGVFVMDGSKRSGHSNAYFAGMGQFRRIVLYDTLIKQLSTDELISVLAHEMGHYVKKHIRNFMIVSSVMSLAGFYILSLLMSWPEFYLSFNIALPSVHTALVVFAIASDVFTFVLTPVMNYLSRRHEYEADRFSVETTQDKDAMKGALLKLTLDNLSNLTPHAAYSFYHYSHPTTVERAKAIEALKIKSEIRISKSKTRSVVVLLLSLLCLGCYSYEVQAQVGVNVSDESVYYFLDKLAAKKLTKQYTRVQRPLSRYAVARLTLDARQKYDEGVQDGASSFIADILEHLENEFDNELKIIKGEKTLVLDLRFVDQINLNVALTDQDELTLNPRAVGGSLNARFHPLFSYKENEHFGKPFATHLGFLSYAEITPYFAIYGEPQFFYHAGTFEDVGVTFKKLYIKSGYKNISIEVGRDQILWGAGQHGGLLFSNNAKALDLIKVTNELPYRFPWVFKHLGGWKASMFFANTGTDFADKNAILSGYRIDYLPFYWLSAGFEHAVYMGGEGANDPGVGTAMGEFVGFVFGSGNSRAQSNHLMGFDMNIKIPPLKGLELYGAVLFEDTNKELVLWLVDNAAWHAGVYMPLIDADGNWSARLEFVRTGPYLYRHGPYADGHTRGAKVLGFDAGPDVYSFTFDLKHYFNPAEVVSGSLRYLRRANNTYRRILDASGDQSGIEIAIDGRTEHHFILGLNGTKKLAARIFLTGEAGLDYIKNWSFGTDDHVDFSFLVALKLDELIKKTK